jgi:hypothetical protein
MSEKFEHTLLESGDLMRRTALGILHNSGKAITIITLIIASLVVFTDLSFQGFLAKNFTATVAVMLTASYLIYFSMEDTGEKAGEDSEEYKSASLEYLNIREKLASHNIDDLREFCAEYSKAELEYRRESLLLSWGESVSDFKKYKDGCENFDKKRVKIFKKAKRLKAVPLSPKTLLAKEHTGRKSELSNPEIFKLLKLAVKLIPTTLCMLVTVSIIPSLKEDLGFAAIVEGLLKLSSLPIIAFRGYSAGYFYVRRSKVAWLETKIRLLGAFLKRQADKQKTAPAD